MLLPLFRQRINENLVGLDIGSDSVKLLSIQSSTTPFHVKDFCIATLPEGAVVKGEIKNPHVVGTRLKELFKQSGIESKSIALAIPRSSAIIKTINVDSRLNSTEIESRAWIEANHLFPDLVGKIYLDFIVNPSEQDPSQMDLMLVACRKDQINPYIEALDDSGLKAKIIDINSDALGRAMNLVMANMPDHKTVALLNLDYNLSTFIVVHEGKQIYAHDHTFDGHRLQARIDEYINSTPDKVASLNDMAYFEILKAALSAHLRHTLHFFYSSRPNIAIQHLILSGDCAILPEIPGFIQQQTDVDLQLANPFMNMTFSSNVNQAELQKAAPLMMLCTGLALSVEKESISDSLD